MSQYFPPAFQEKKFHCPFCGVLSQQWWFNGCGIAEGSGHNPINQVKYCQCGHCSAISIWREGCMLFPDSGSAPLPHPEMPADVSADFSEARGIVTKSPRGAAALLRLAIQKLMVDLGEKGKDINTDIGNLVTKGLPLQIQQALDSVRVIGNFAVHPGELNLKDTPDLAHALFELVNIIVDVMIAQPKRVQAVYNSLPQPKLQAIHDRDGT